MMKAEGFAIAVGDVIEVRTVSPTERAAKINWLVVARAVPVGDDWSNEVIEKVWKHYTTETDIQCIAVTIAAKEDKLLELGNLETTAEISPDIETTVNKPARTQ